MRTAGNFSFAMVAVCKDRNAVDSHHLPKGTHSLAPRPGSLDRLTFQNGAGVRGDELVVEPPASLSPDQNHERPVPVQANWSAWQDLHLQPFRLERNASSDWATRGSLRTVTIAHGHKCPRSDMHRHWTRFKCAASPLGYVGKMACRAEARRAKDGAA